MADDRFPEPRTEVPAALDRNVEDNSFDWQRAGGSDDAAGGAAGQRPGMDQPAASSRCAGDEAAGRAGT